MEGFIIQPYDILMLGLLVGLAVLGAWKGVAWQIASLSSLVVSWLVAVRFGRVLAPLISDNEPWNRFIAMLLLYMGTSLAIWAFFRLVNSEPIWPHREPPSSGTSSPTHESARISRIRSV